MAARWQMAISLGSHIILSCFGVALPAMIFAVHRRGIRHNDQVALDLAHKWAKAAAVLFAVGAVSGTILSFEMGLLWPGLMSTYGDVLGLPFALEGIAFFVEAIFMGIYLYGWGRLPQRTHLLTLVPMIISGVFGTFCVLAVNAWMNAPSGFTRLADGTITDVDPLGAIFNRAVWQQFSHMLVACYAVTGLPRGRGVRQGNARRSPRRAPPARLHRAVHVRRHRRAHPAVHRPRRRECASTATSPRSSPQWSSRPPPRNALRCTSAGC